ncbi:MAG: lipid-A-disaccharide synthase [Deltaproteobacteria bacterium]|nr:lipid-A-disaccharide synthase [Deltaproteobacteria bacterium]
MGISTRPGDPGRSRLILLVAGEASADLHGSLLVRAIRRREPATEFWGIGGEKMEDAGVRILFPSSEMAVVGLTEVLSRLRLITRAFLELKSILKSGRPDLLILIDYPDFNLPLARAAKRFHVPVLYYISPQVWAWRPGRVKKLVRRVDRMAVILPFEKNFYRQRGMAVDYVGHPLLDIVPPDLCREEVLRGLGLSERSPVLGLLPGSRKEEVTHLLPDMVRAAAILRAHYPDLSCLLPLASTISPDLIEPIIRPSPVPIHVQRDIYRVLAACDAALVASGTATLETAIMLVPMVIAYRVSPITFWFARRLVRVPHIGLVNVIAGEEIVPELIQEQVTPGRLAEEALRFLGSSQRRENVVDRLRGLRNMLGKGSASDRTAEIAIELMAERPRARTG